MPAVLLLAAALVLALALTRTRQAAPGSAYVGDLPLADGADSAPDPEPAAGTLAGTVFSAGQAVLDTVGAAVSRIFTLPDRAAPFADTIRDAEVKNSLPESLLGRVLYQESRFRPEIIDGTVQSPAGAIGIAQIIPRWHPGVDPRDPIASTYYSAGYLQRLYRQFGSWADALAAYNWGEGNWAAFLKTGRGARGQERPQENIDYVADISRDVGLS